MTGEIPFSRWRPLGRKALRLPGLRALHPLARRVLAVAGPPELVAQSGRPVRSPRGECQGLTILSANLWHDWPRYRRLADRLEAFAGLVEAQGVDVILLQEVARTPNLRVDEWLAERLDMAYVYSRANGHAASIGFEEGLAVFSRFPLADPQLIRLSPPGEPFIRRMALGATLDTPCGEILAVSVHLSLRRGRNAAQQALLRRWIPSIAGERCAFIGGDFNAQESSAPIAQAQRAWLDTYRALFPVQDGTTHELRWPWGPAIRRNRFDYVFLRPAGRAWQVLRARHLQSPGLPHSDHRAVLAQLAPLTP
jgi:endonuclease/exonuclease/phosphatase family metal-dependent hydrolase